MQIRITRLRAVTMLLIFSCAFLRANAQYNTPQNKVWAFGTHAGLDFASGSPVAITTSVNKYEGTACVCDSSGNLLFYTSGDTVWNKLGNKIPNGSGIVPYSCNSTSQAAVIVKLKGTASKYYIFSLESISGIGKLCYSIVDMSLNGGLGDITASKGVSIDSGLSEKMIAVRGTNGIWLLVHKRNTADFLAYRITASGIAATPVVSNVGLDTNYGGYGVMKISHDCTKLAALTYGTGGGTTRTELFDFNPATGVVSNCIVLNTRHYPYGCEFSPDNTKLYVQYWTVGDLFQYDISLSTAAAIAASEFNVSWLTGFSTDLKLGPDGKIYLAKANEFYLNRIDYPNLAGAACGYTDSVVFLGSNSVQIGMPNTFWTDTSTTNITTVPKSDIACTLKTYPNPAANTLTIEVPEENEAVITVTDLSGRVIKVIRATPLGRQLQVDVSDIVPGNYVVKIEGGGKVYRSKVTIADARGQ